MRKVPLGLCVIGVLVIPQTLAAQSMDFGSMLDPARALNALPAELGKLYPSFQLIGFLLLCIGLVTQLVGTHTMQDNLRAITKACLLAGVIALIPLLAGKISTIASGLAQGVDQGGLRTAQRIALTNQSANDYFFQAAQTGNGMEEAARLAKDASWWQVPLVYVKGAIKDTVNGMAAMVSLLRSLPEALTRLVLVIVFFLATLVSYFIQYLMGMIQFFLLNASLIFMPVFVAGLATNFYRSQSTSFITGWIGIASWPIGWGLWNIGTVAFCDVIAAFISSLTVTAVPAGMAMGSVIPGVGTVAGAVVAGKMALFCLTVLSLMLFVWVVAGAFVAPFLMQKMVTAGSNYFAGAVTSGGGAAMAAAGTAVKAAASLAAPGVGTAAASSGGSLMQALSRGSMESGFDMSSMVGAAVPDTRDMADPIGDKGNKMYARSETARRAAARSAVKDSVTSLKGLV